MTRNTETTLDFGPRETVDGSLSETVRGLAGSEILKIAAEIRELLAAGHSVCNLTVGDFDPKLFPIPELLHEGIRRAYAAGETNYPPADGMPSLRRAVADYTARQWNVRYPLESVLVASGARPVLYAAYRSVLNPGDAVVYSIPSWNNSYYAWISAARALELTTRVENGFLPTLDMIRPHLTDARLLCINTPLNPAGTVMEPEQLRAITRAVVEENERRTRAGRRHLFLLLDQVYAALVFGAARHVHPVQLVPESAPWVISLDGVSKAFAATGLRVGWVLAAPALVARMKDLIGHMGAWAPRPEQVAFAEFLEDEAACRTFQSELKAKVQERLDTLHRGFQRMKAEGLPVDCVHPQGAIYLSLRLDVLGRSIEGSPLRTNEELRKLLLEKAGLALVPFQAFGLREDSGWFRISVGAVSVEEIEKMLPRVAQLLSRVARG